MIDLLWAEAARLEDLPPYELITAADAKARSGHLNRARLSAEVLRLGGWGLGEERGTLQIPFATQNGAASLGLVA